MILRNNVSPLKLSFRAKPGKAKLLDLEPAHFICFQRNLNRIISTTAELVSHSHIALTPKADLSTPRPPSGQAVFYVTKR